MPRCWIAEGFSKPVQTSWQKQKKQELQKIND
jgi:hypothetical protein